MKKLFVTLSLFTLFICNIIVEQKNFSFRDYFDNGILYTYTKKPIDESSIFLANNYMTINASSQQEVLGESVYFENLELGSAINTLQADIKFTEYLKNEQLTIIYAYSNLIPTHKYVNNYKINLQISVANDYIVIGWPLILGSF